MKNKITTTIRITTETREKLDELKSELGWSIMWLTNRAINNYYKITLGNRIKIKS